MNKVCRTINSLVQLEYDQADHRLMALNAAVVTQKWDFCFENWQVFIVRGSLYTLTLGLKSEPSPLGAGLRMKDTLTQR